MLAFTGYATFQPAEDSELAAALAAGYGFVSFSDLAEGARALKEMNGRYIGNRPCKLKKSHWQDRTPQELMKVSHKRIAALQARYTALASTSAKHSSGCPGRQEESQALQHRGTQGKACRGAAQVTLSWPCSPLPPLTH